MPRTSMTLSQLQAALVVLAYASTGATHEPTPPGPPSLDAVSDGELAPSPAPNSTERALEFSTWRPEDVRTPSVSLLVEQPQASGMPVERANFNASAKLAAGTLALMCPGRAVACESRAGMFLALTLLHRAERWFAWGGSFEGFTASQVWAFDEGSLALTHNLLSGRLLAQLHPLSESRVDPYFGLGLGAGFITTRADGNFGANGSSPQALSETTNVWTPFYAARFGIDVDVTHRLAVGVMADWSNWLALTGENCPWKTFGACSANGFGAFPADNAVWKLGVEVSFAFGQEL